MFFECRMIDTLFNKNSKISEQVSRSISSTWSTFWLISLTLWKINALKRSLLHLSSTNVSSIKYGEDSMRNKMWRVIRVRESTWKQLVKVFLSFRASCWEPSKKEPPQLHLHLYQLLTYHIWPWLIECLSPQVKRPKKYLNIFGIDIWKRAKSGSPMQVS